MAESDKSETHLDMELEISAVETIKLKPPPGSTQSTDAGRCLAVDGRYYPEGTRWCVRDNKGRGEIFVCRPPVGRTPNRNAETAASAPVS